jgi:hypothetical protein
MVILMPYAALIPMTTLSAVLIIVAYNMSGWREFISMRKSPKSDFAVLLITFVLTVCFDLVVAIEVGMIAAAIFFMSRMANTADVRKWTDYDEIYSDEKDADSVKYLKIPEKTVVYEITGPMFFGASDKLLELLGVTRAEPIDGEVRIDKSIIIDKFEKDDLADRFEHRSLYSGGGLCEAVGDVKKVISVVTNDKGDQRAYLSLGDGIAWVRGSFPHDPNRGGSLPNIIPANTAFPVASLMRSALALLGLKVSFKAISAADALPVSVISDGKESMFLTTFAKNMNVRMFMSTPLGAPVCTGLDAIVENDTSEMISPKWQHEEMQVFIKQKERSQIITRHEINGPYLRADKRLSVAGLIDARVYIRLPEPFAHAEVAKFGPWPIHRNSEPMKYTEDGMFAYADGLTGAYNFTFQTKDTRDEYIEKGYIHDDATFFGDKVNK